MKVLADVVEVSDWNAASYLAWAAEDYLDILGYWTDHVVLIQAGLQAAKNKGDLHEKGAWLGSLGSVYFDLGQFEEAIDCFTQTILLLSDVDGKARAHRNQAVAFIRLNRLDEAEGDCRESERLAPDHPYTHALWGQLCYARGDFPVAVNRYRKAADLNHIDRTEFNFDLALPLLCLGEVEEAFSAIKARLAAHPQPSDLKSMIPEYEALQERRPELGGVAEALELLREAAGNT